MENKLNLKSDIFAIIWIISVLLILLYSYQEYMINHKYYYNMLSNISNINLVISSFVISLIITFVLFYKKNIKYFILSLFFGLIIWWWIWIWSKSPWLLWSGFLIWIFNVFVIFLIVILFIISISTIWRWIKIKLFWIKENNLFGVITWFGLWLVLFLIINYLLILFNFYYSIVNWIIFLGMIFVSFFFLFDLFKDTIKIVNNSLNDFFSQLTNNYLILLVAGFLVIISLMYFLFGFVMSYIPYPTAWDANHAYMFYPKMWVLNNWFYWDEPSMNTPPYLWLGYIAFWFSLFMPFVNSFWIAPDTLAVVMNFFSWIFVLFFTLAILSTFFFEKNQNNMYKNVLFFTWWFIILIWLTSWMWAFLVFVDNKTDLGVFSMTLLALYSGFLLFKNLYDKKFNINLSQDSLIWKLAVISGLFFAVAVASKPTAFFDVVNFVFFFVFTVFSHGLTIAIFSFILAYLVYSKFRWIVDYIPSDKFKVIWVIWSIFTILGIWELFYRFKNNFNKFFSLFVLIFVWWLSFLVFLVLIKWVWIWMEIIYYDRFNSLVEIVKAILFT